MPRLQRKRGQSVHTASVLCDVSLCYDKSNLKRLEVVYISAPQVLTANSSHIYMSNSAKTGIAIVVVIIIIAICWVWYSSSKSVSTPTSPVESVVPIASPSASPAAQGPNLNGTGLSASTDTSNASLQSDATAIDQQMNGLNTDTSNVNAGLSGGTSIPVQQ